MKFKLILAVYLTVWKLIWICYVFSLWFILIFLFVLQYICQFEISFNFALYIWQFEIFLYLYLRHWLQRIVQLSIRLISLVNKSVTNTRVKFMKKYNLTTWKSKCQTNFTCRSMFRTSTYLRYLITLAQIYWAKVFVFLNLQYLVLVSVYIHLNFVLSLGLGVGGNTMYSPDLKIRFYL